MKLLEESVSVEKPEINLTPLVDVALVLVIIFLATATLATPAGIRILTTGTSPAARNEPVKIEISSSGTRVDGKLVAESELAGSLRAALVPGSGRGAWVVVGPGITHERAVAVMELARQAGASSIALDNLPLGSR